MFIEGFDVKVYSFVNFISGLNTPSILTLTNALDWKIKGVSWGNLLGFILVKIDKN